MTNKELKIQANKELKVLVQSYQEQVRNIKKLKEQLYIAQKELKDTEKKMYELEDFILSK